MEPEQRSRILWQLVGVVNRLRITGAKSVRRDRRVAVAIASDKSPVQMRHHAHVIPKRRKPRIDWDPIRVNFRKVTGVADIEWGAALRDHRHAERTCLPAKSRTIVLSPERRRRQVGMQLSCNLPLREGVLIDSAWCRDHDSSTGHW